MLVAAARLDQVGVRGGPRGQAVGGQGHSLGQVVVVEEAEGGCVAARVGGVDLRRLLSVLEEGLRGGRGAAVGIGRQRGGGGFGVERPVVRVGVVGLAVVIVVVPIFQLDARIRHGPSDPFNRPLNSPDHLPQQTVPVLVPGALVSDSKLLVDQGLDGLVHRLQVVSVVLGAVDLLVLAAALEGDDGGALYAAAEAPGAADEMLGGISGGLFYGHGLLMGAGGG